jgi:hypothetical protein
VRLVLLAVCLLVLSGTQPIPNNEVALAQDLYTSLQEFYKRYKQYKDRPLYITGEVGVGVGLYLFSKTHARLCG